MSNLSIETERKIAQSLAGFYDDPLGFVMFAYPWGRPTLPDGSPNPLRDKKGPEPWQRKFLLALGKHIKNVASMKGFGFDVAPWRSAISSGHGVGKSAMISWLIQFFMSTRPDTRGVVTANTATQLETRTWPELAKWHALLINRHWFTWTATSYFFAKYPEDRQKNYMFTAATVSENNTVAFQGLHNEGKTLVVMFDEASGITSKLWEVVEGALTDGEAFFFAKGNPNEPVGDFADCFGVHKALYYTDQVDTRSVSYTNQEAIKVTIQKLGGEETNETKVRIRGIFPSQSYSSFIDLDAVRLAMSRELIADRGAALVLGIDVARYGRDKTVWTFRQGNDARSRPRLALQGLNNVRVADITLDLCLKYKPDVVCIESVGPGVGVIDILRHRGVRVIDIHPGSQSNVEGYYRRRDELWGKTREWIREQGCLPEIDPELMQQLPAFNYTLDTKTGAYRLETKDEMRERLNLSTSPDEADSLVLTFGVNAMRRDAGLYGGFSRERALAVSDYDVLSY